MQVDATSTTRASGVDQIDAKRARPSREVQLAEHRLQAATVVHANILASTLVALVVKLLLPRARFPMPSVRSVCLFFRFCCY